ncbi:MAG: response regulator [Sphingomonadaceae bacterium]|jgi:two-component system, response regulator PdtaR|nr:MAG: response regulator [Sphingomonadaceae bacterium]
MDAPYVFVAEDEIIIGHDLCQTMKEAGCEVEGPLPDVSSTMLAYQKRKPDVAILDIHLGDDNVLPLAEKLIAENVQVIFHSGLYKPEDIAERFPGATFLQKPVPPSKMLDTVKAKLESA